MFRRYKQIGSRLRFKSTIFFPDIPRGLGKKRRPRSKNTRTTTARSNIYLTEREKKCFRIGYQIVLVCRGEKLVHNLADYKRVSCPRTKCIHLGWRSVLSRQIGGKFFFLPRNYPIFLRLFRASLQSTFFSCIYHASTNLFRSISESEFILIFLEHIPECEPVVIFLSLIDFHMFNCYHHSLVLKKRSAQWVIKINKYFITLSNLWDGTLIKFQELRGRKKGNKYIFFCSKKTTLLKSWRINYKTKMKTLNWKYENITNLLLQSSNL